eukprot:CAMPEP_0179425334 /NCGR_PEP_ID=MMETSP0799-20121207/12112_1 /TAXON_ID=46947 /ORGANISM="Geminigera cryophila, Strain CCMP2564" /LENGTH=387 /DNA_ID=CAMNT_0021199937 /DNA_START=215 /DNA_END=1375 /DNA_ORIENTATION=+
MASLSDQESEFDDDEMQEEESQLEMTDLVLWKDAGGQDALEAAINAVKKFGYGASWSTRSWSNEVVMGLELPFERLGLSTERAHSLRLEPGCTVVIKIIVNASERAAQGLLKPSRPGDMHKIVNTRTDSAAGSDVTAEFGMRWSLEHLLNSFFTSILAVESLEHDPMPVAKGSSLPYVRQLHHNLTIDSEDYSKLENFSVRSHALENAAEEATSGPRSQWLDSAEEHGEAEMNPLLRLAHFVRHQIELASHYCLVCHAPMVVLGVRPFVCDNLLCVHQFEELGLGANPDVEVEKNPEVVDLLISLCWHYVSKAPALENMPSWKMLRGFRRCTGTLDSFEFNSSSATGPDMSAIPNTQSCLRLTGRDTKLQSELKAGDSIRIVASDGV